MLPDWFWQGACAAPGIGRPPAPFIVKHAWIHTKQTASFALPILERLAEDPYGIFAVVLTAGRELAQQIAEQFVALGSGMTLRVAVVTGGADTIAQCTEVIPSSIPGCTPQLLAFTAPLGVVVPCSCSYQRCHTLSSLRLAGLLPS